ncbi:hypothetical protein HN873_010728 [Arachis hypogaea]|uniref:VQ domain-containing protein n=2 Tax=Arachis hypogaea TaxID=3818 RepID=A0A445DMI4_ARAHY|nr:uncharacterized protein LOC112734633 [Arachis hypogaea]QHO60111.1 uncharacterized protein DS421_3g104620 [Arachis hypogaea]RYR64246.1 hypothetical protein Ahy_A03g010372 isoform A [Arachis hypogaea]
MSGAMAATTTDHHKWMMQLYEQPQMDCDGSNMAPPIMEAFSDATVVTTMSPESSSMMMLSQISNSSSSTSISNVQLLSPKRNNNNNSAFKPIRKRSRASRRTPTTLLNANTNNFRELVQKFTGCGSTHMSLSIHKGPITLNFQQGSNNNDNNHKMILHHYHHQQQQQQNSTTTSGTVSPFGTRTSNYYFHNQQAHNHDVAAVMPSSQEQQSGGGGLISTSLDSNLPSYDVDYLSSSRPTSMDASEDFGLHQLTVNDFSNNGIKGSGFFM